MTTSSPASQEEKKEEGSVEVDYEADSSEENRPQALGVEPSTGQALENGQLPLEQSLSGDLLPLEQQTLVDQATDQARTGALALSVDPATALVQEPLPIQEKEDVGEEETSGGDTSDSGMTSTSDVIMREDLTIGSPIADTSMPVLNARNIMEIVENKEISIKNPRLNHNLQRVGLEDNLFEFGDALQGYTSDGGTIRINQGSNADVD
jgi:hypothetical protein